MSKQKQFTERINVFFTADQLEMIRNEAEKYGMTVSGYVRYVVLHDEVGKYLRFECENCNEIREKDGVLVCHLDGQVKKKTDTCKQWW